MEDNGNASTVGALVHYQWRWGFTAQAGSGAQLFCRLAQARWIAALDYQPTCLLLGLHEAQRPRRLAGLSRLAAAAARGGWWRGLARRPPLQPHQLLAIPAGRTTACVSVKGCLGSHTPGPCASGESPRQGIGQCEAAGYLAEVRCMRPCDHSSPASSLLALSSTMLFILQPPHLVLCSRVRKKPSGALALKEPLMRDSRHPAAPTLAQ